MFGIKHYKETADYIKQKIDLAPQVGIILGTGLSELVDHVAIDHTIEYEEIPNFPVSTVESHKGRLIFGTLANKRVMIMQGRFHYYEGYSMQELTIGVRAMKLLGVEQLLVSNVSGGLNHEYEIGDVMIIEDHINLLPDNPLIGPNIDELGPRFPDMLNAYNPEWVDKAYAIGQAQNYRIHKGVYVAVMGPNLETPAEYNFLHKIGADAVGMSTIPEVIVARHMDLPVFGISIITDLGIPGKIKKVEIPEIIKVANEAQPKLTYIMENLMIGN